MAVSSSCIYCFVNILQKNKHNVQFLHIQIDQEKQKKIAPPSITIAMDKLLVESWFKIIFWTSTGTQ